MRTLFFLGRAFWSKVTERPKAFLLASVVVAGFLFAVVGGSLVYAQPTPTSPAAAQTGATNNSSPGLLTSIGKDIVNAVSIWITQIFLTISTLLLKLSSFCVDFVILIASYNGFIDSTAVNIGWTIVRDFTNMLFIVFLLGIAFGTILGLEGYEWKQLLPKLVISAILVNFSRTICGLMIDASQVFMMTFLNAISATIGGNVINAFSLTSFQTLHQTQSDAFLSPGIIISAIASVAFSAVVLGILGAYVFILLGRIIRLWVLIVLSPIAFVLNAFPATARFASEWWHEIIDDLVTGPVLLFFIWLSFVIVGTGQASQELLQGSKLVDRSPIDQAFSPSQGQSAGPTDALRWNNLANFVIAVGVLLAGARVASHIGGSSGNLIEQGLSFGGKVATIATGYGLGKTIFGGAKDAAVGAAGGIAGMITSPFRRAGRSLGAVASGVAYDVGRKRNKLATQLRESAANSWFGARLAAGFGASILETRDQADKTPETYEKIAKLKASQYKEALKTPASLKTRFTLQAAETALAERESAVGKAKNEAAIQNETMKAVAEVGENLSSYRKKVGDAEANLKEAQAIGVPGDIDLAYKDLNAAKATLAEQEGLEQKKVVAKYGKSKLVDADSLMDYYRASLRVSGAEAEQRDLEEIVNENKRKIAARERDAILIGKGMRPFHERAELARINAEKREYLKHMTYDDVADMANDITTKMGSLDTSISGLMAKPVRTAQDNYRLTQLRSERAQQQKEMSRLYSFAASRGGSYLTTVAQTAYKPYFTDDVRTSDVAGLEAQLMSGLLQRRVDANRAALDAAWKDLEKQHGENFVPFIDDFVNNSQNAGEEGALRMASLIRRDVDRLTGKPKVRLIDLDSSTNPDHAADLVEWKRGATNADNASLKITNRPTLRGSLDEINKSLAIRSARAARQFAKFGALSATQVASNIDEYDVDSMREALRNATAMKENHIRRAVQALAARSIDAKKQNSGWSTLLQRLSVDDVLKKVPEFVDAAGNVKSAEDIYDLVKPDATGKKLDQILEDIENDYP